jgi:hypothetical protein
MIFSIVAGVSHPSQNSGFNAVQFYGGFAIFIMAAWLSRFLTYPSQKLSGHKQVALQGTPGGSHIASVQRVHQILMGIIEHAQGGIVVKELV